jgi:hypothetical protein
MCVGKYHRKYKVGNEIKEIMSSETVDEDEQFLRVNSSGDKRIKGVKQRTKKGVKVKVQRKITHKKK